MESEAGHYTTLLRMPENTELELMSKNVGENGLILKPVIENYGKMKLFMGRT
jgi:hypothetical protein